MIGGHAREPDDPPPLMIRYPWFATSRYVTHTDAMPLKPSSMRFGRVLETD